MTIEFTMGDTVSTGVMPVRMRRRTVLPMAEPSLLRQNGHGQGLAVEGEGDRIVIGRTEGAAGIVGEAIGLLGHTDEVGIQNLVVVDVVEQGDTIGARHQAQDIPDDLEAVADRQLFAAQRHFIAASIGIGAVVERDHDMAGGGRQALDPDGQGFVSVGFRSGNHRQRHSQPSGDKAHVEA